MTSGHVDASLHGARRLLAALMCVMVCVMACGAARCADNVDVSAHAANGAGVEVHARATLSAPHELIWQTLTDYDQLANFIPGMHKSRVVQWRGHTALVEQEGVARFLLFSVPINVTVESLHQPPGVIAVRLVKGNLRQLEGGYRIDRVAEGEERFVLRWAGVIEAETGLPQLISVPLMRASIAEQFLGMVAEIERRESARVKTMQTRQGK